MDGQKKLKGLIINISINVVISQILFWLAFFLNPSEEYVVLDSFFVTGFAFLLFALLRVLTSEGVFYSVNWAMKKTIDLFRKKPKYNYKFFEYVESRRNEPKGIIWPNAAVGLIYFIVSLVMYLIIR